MAATSSSTERPPNAFVEITPSASSSTTLRQRPYDVFINHRGPDVKLNLASPIYHFLDSLGVKAFFDREELDLGNLVPQAIDNAMRSALIHIAIFSKDYAASPWCLAELSFILETKTPIIPVFYDVEPADLKWGATKLYGEAFSNHETSRRYDSKTLAKWKWALHKASSHTGSEFKSDHGDLGILVRDVVDRVQQEIKNKKVPLEVAKYPVGLDDTVRDFEGVIRSAPVDQTAQIVGIVGMCGCGKTTLAKELYNRNFKSFDKCSFLPDVRKAELPDLQKKLLEDLVHLRDLSFMDASEGKRILAERLRSSRHRMLIVLDGVDKVDQLNFLLPEDGKSLGSDSLVIVTTGDSRVLQLFGISSVYKMTTLDPCHAKELFCQYAFRQVSPPADLEGLVQEIINACNGLPFSLQVIGEMLCGKTDQEKWKSDLKKISRSLPNKIKQRLKPSYDALDEEEGEIFLDVACFFDGEKKSLASAVWKDEWSDLQTLEDKCLVEVDKQNRLKMHGQLRELGRQIAIERPPHRLWKEEQIKQKQRMPIRGIMAATTQFVKRPAHEEFPRKSASYRVSLQEMDLTFLKLLVVDGDHFNSFAHLPMDLVWLRVFDFQLTNLPSWLSLKELRVLELYGTSSFQQLWENNAQLQPPKQLREMIITATEDNIFHSFPIEVSGLENLTKIALISYKGEEFQFTELPDEFCDLKSLEYLELRYCTRLSSLPDQFGDLKKLEHLDLRSCKELRKLPESFQQLTHLKYLDLSDCKKLGLEEDVLKNFRELENLYR